MHDMVEGHAADDNAIEDSVTLGTEDDRVGLFAFG